MSNPAEKTSDWQAAPEYHAITAIRTLSMDAVQQANSGHPGTPVALAPLAYTLWQRFLNYDPADAAWPNRDRFVLSAGHASMLLYSVLHLAGVKALDEHEQTTDKPAMPLEEIKRFRQWESRTPGHPEYEHTTGVETTTGPLGSGAATSVGMAIASKWLGSYFNRPDFELFNYRTYAIAGDGDMMEGISGEAASLAGHLKLDNLCWFYDSNRITIDGTTSLSFSEDVATRFLGYGWNVARVADANDLETLSQSIQSAQYVKDRPTFVIVNSHIAWGVPGKQDSNSAHGEPLGADKVKSAKEFYGCPNPGGKFEECLFPGVYDHFAQGIGKRGAEAHAAWSAKLARYREKYPELAAQLDTMLKGELPAGWDKDIPKFPSGEVDDPKTGKKKIAGAASRDSGGVVLNSIAKNVPWLMGGSADLAASTKTTLKFEGATDFKAGNWSGRNFHFGIREHAMGAIINGMTLCKLRAFGSGFLIFSDYGRPQIRLGALMQIAPIYVFTHDSISVGEDGPTHQPIEQLASLRAMPNLLILRPADANEVAEAWKVIMQTRHSPICLLLSRQELTTIDRSKCAPASGLAKGAYVLSDAPNGKPDVLLLATGSEVGHCLKAQETLKAEGIAARVVSMPSFELFEKTCQADPSYREKVLPSAVTARVSIEQGAIFGWHQYVGPTGSIIGMRRFGASAPGKVVEKEFGFTAEHVVEEARKQVKR